MNSSWRSGQAIPFRIQNVSRRIVGAILPWIVLLSLIGCATPTTLTSLIDGTEITEHLDDRMPRGCEQAFPTGGCYQMRDGKHHVWYSRLSWPYVRKHEIAHAQGMRHTNPWIWDGKSSCAMVTTSGGGYLKGQRICVGARGEYVYGTDFKTADISIFGTR